MPRIFLYGHELALPEAMTSLEEPALMRVRGYRLWFVARQREGDDAIASITPIRGDGTVPGVAFEVDEASLLELDALMQRSGASRVTLHLEPIAPGRSHPTVEAFAYVHDGASARAPSQAYASALQRAWVEAGLPTGALDFALDFALNSA